MNEVVYQNGAPDEFHHKYLYDADNRITNVYTSQDGDHYEQDAKYFYYAHGPLARTELGDKKSQAMDYAYTIQGWIKTVNGEELTAANTMGKNGVATHQNQFVAQNAFGYSLSYFDNDYRSSDTSMLDVSYNAQGTLAQDGLFNGNIRNMVTAQRDHNEAALGTQLYAYQYDQLNRLKEMNSYAVTPGSITASHFQEAMSYDANGNILTLDRKDGSNELFDDFSYNYQANTNRLLSIDDASSSGSNGALGDITDQSTNNYVYDAIGQLVHDEAEEIDSITWTVTNKVKRIIRPGGSSKGDVEFVYDAMGQRLAKKEYTSGGAIEDITYYVRDAQGNPMSVYTWKKESGDSNLYVTERDLYGSSRLGMEQVNKKIASSDTFSLNISYLSGDKFFELGNHLGNVLNVVTDRKLPHNSSGSIDYFMADVVSYSDYYPFGQLLPGRHGSESNYRYGYQGSECDDEIKGEGNSYTTEFRQLDPRIGRWLSLDPLMMKYPDASPYTAMNNNPVWYNDINGLEGSKSGGDIDKKTHRKYNKLKKEGEKLSKESRRLAEEQLKQTPGGEIKSYTDKNNFQHYYVNDKEGNLDLSSAQGLLGNKWRDFEDRANPIYEKVRGKYYSAGEAIGIQFSIGAAFIFGGGGSYSIDFTFVGDTYSIGNTVGGGFGLETGYAIDAQFIFAEKAGRYTASDVQVGRGFVFSVGIGPANYTRTGDFADSHGRFAWNGDQTTSSNLGLNQDLFIQSAQILAGKNAKLVSELVILGTRMGKLKITASYQWTGGYEWIGN